MKRNIIQLVEVPDSLFIKSLQVLNLASARILSKAERNKLQHGSPDVEIVSVNGKKELISRKEFIDFYRTSAGKTIKIGGLRENKKYWVIGTRGQNNEVAVLNLPKASSIRIVLSNNRLLTPGYMCICEIGEGGIEKENGVQLNPEIAKKTLVFDKRDFRRYTRLKDIPSQRNVPERCDIFEPDVEELRHQYVRNDRSREAAKDLIEKEQWRKKEAEKVPEITAEVRVPTRNKSEEKEITEESMRVDAPYKVVAQLVNMENETIGYKLQTESGIKNISIKKTIELSSANKIKNMCVVNRNDSLFLRCIGTTHEALPKAYK